MTFFVESPVSLLAFPPHTADVTVHVFFTKIHPRAIQAYCDRFLNIERSHQPYVFKALAGYGLITIEQRAMDTNLAPPTPEFIDPEHMADSTNVNKLTVSVPLLRYENCNNVLLNPQVCWMQPVNANNSSNLVFTDRELIGLDTLHAAIQAGEAVGGQSGPPTDLGAAPIVPTIPGSLSVDVLLSTIVSFSPISPKELLNFLTIRTGPGLATPPAPKETAYTGPEPQRGPMISAIIDTNTDAAIQELRKAFPFLDSVFDTFGFVSVDTVTLKQFRGLEDIESAAYQALVQQRVAYTDMRDIEYYDPAGVRITFWPTAMTREFINVFLDLPAASLAPDFHPLDRIEQALSEKFSIPETSSPEQDESPTTFAFRFRAQVTLAETTTLHVFG